MVRCSTLYRPFLDLKLYSYREFVAVCHPILLGLMLLWLPIFLLPCRPPRQMGNTNWCVFHLLGLLHENHHLLFYLLIPERLQNYCRFFLENFVEKFPWKISLENFSEKYFWILKT